MLLLPIMMQKKKKKTLKIEAKTTAKDLIS